MRITPNRLPVTISITTAQMPNETSIALYTPTSNGLGYSRYQNHLEVDFGDGMGKQKILAQTSIYAQYTDTSIKYLIKLNIENPHHIHNIDWSKAYGGNAGIRVGDALDLTTLNNLKTVRLAGGGLTLIKLPASIVEAWIGEIVTTTSNRGQNYGDALGLGNVDFGNLNRLKSLSLARSGVKTVILPISDVMEELYLQYNPLTSYNRLPTSLKKLWFSSSLNDSTHGNGIEFDGGAGIPNIDLTGLNVLEEFYAHDSGIETLILPDSDSIKTIGISKNKINSIVRAGVNVHKLPASLEVFVMGFKTTANIANGGNGTGFKVLDFRNCNNLQICRVATGHVEEVYFPENDTVTEIYLPCNKIRYINRIPTSVQYLYLGYGAGGASNTSYGQWGATSKIGNLNLSECNNLVEIDIRDSGLTSVEWPASKTQVTRLLLGPAAIGSAETRNSNDFSVSGIDLTGFDNLVGYLSICSCNVSSDKVTMPENVDGITHLNLTNNNFSLGVNGQSNLAINRYFNLEYLYANGCNLPTINVSELTKLKYLYLDSVGYQQRRNKLPEIDLSNNVQLQRVYLDYSDVSNIVLPATPSLEYFYAENCNHVSYGGQTAPISLLDVSGNLIDMIYLFLNNTKINHIKLPNKHLMGFRCGETTDLTVLDIPINYTCIPTSTSTSFQFQVLNTPNLASRAYPLGTQIRANYIRLINCGISATDMNTTINNVFINRNNFYQSANKTLELQGISNAIPSGVYQQPTGFTHDLTEQQLTDTAINNNWSSKEKIWVLLNCKVSGSQTASRYNWATITTN